MILQKIGVICEESEIAIVREFFQLFKTPWELYQSRKKYEVVLSTTGFDLPEFDGKLLLVFSSKITEIDIRLGLSVEETQLRSIEYLNETPIPLYLMLASLIGQGSPIGTGPSGESLAIEAKHDASYRILRVGFDLFKEVFYVLDSGQPVENAGINSKNV